MLKQRKKNDVMRAKFAEDKAGFIQWLKDEYAKEQKDAESRPVENECQYWKLYTCSWSGCDKLESRRAEFKLCSGCKAPQGAPRAERVVNRYCSVEHQRLDWQAGHKQSC